MSAYKYEIKDGSLNGEDKAFEVNVALWHVMYQEIELEA